MYSPAEVAKNVIGIGKGKAALSPLRQYLLGCMAGLFIALAAVCANTASANIDNAGVAKLLSGAVFPLGLIMVLIAGSELFTGNCLMIIPVLSKEIKLSSMLKNWFFVYLGNFTGAVFVAFFVVLSGQLDLFGGALAVTTIKIAVNKCSLDFGKAVLLGMFCNILVCIAVWISFAAKTVSGKIIGLYFPIMAFVVCGFEHVVANMYYIPAGLFALLNEDYVSYAASSGLDSAALNIGNFFVNNIIPVTIGNILGGCLVVGFMYWLIYLRPSAGGEAK